MLSTNDAILIAMALKGINQKQLADAVNMSPSTLSEFLKGKTTKLDISKAQGISKALGCTLDYIVGNDTIDIDVSTALKSEREEQGYTSAEVSAVTKIPEALLLKYESDDEPVSAFLLEKLCAFYGMSVPAFLQKYDFYDEYIPAQFNGDVDAYEAFKNAEREDAIRESNGYPELEDIINKGLYTVKGQSARRSFKMSLDLVRQQIYMDPYAIWCATEKIPGDDSAALDEICQVMPLIASVEQIRALNADLKKVKNSDSYTKYSVAMQHYVQARTLNNIGCHLADMLDGKI